MNVGRACSKPSLKDPASPAAEWTHMGTESRKRKISFGLTHQVISREFSSIGSADPGARQATKNQERGASEADDDTPQYGMIRQTALKIEQDDRLRNFIIAMIWINLVQFGASVQWKEPPLEILWVVMDQLFTCTFVAEMILKLVAYRRAYFHEIFNIVDFILAWMAMFSSCMTFLGLNAIHLSAFRILRLFRTLRVARAVKPFRQLSLLIEGCAESVSAMAWIGVLMFLIIYLLAIICMALFDAFGTPQTLSFKFSSVPNAMLTIFNMVLLTEWSQIVWSVSREHPWMVLIFTTFIVFTNFGIMNVAIGIVVERALSVSNRQREEDVLEFKKQQMREVDELKQFFLSIDSDKDAFVSRQELHECSAGLVFQDWVGRLGLPAAFTLPELYTMLDGDASGALTANEFVKGLYRAVHSNEFQRSCMIDLSINQVKQLVLQSKKDILSAIEKCTDRIRAELHEICDEKLRSACEQTELNIAGVHEGLCRVDDASEVGSTTVGSCSPEHVSNFLVPSALDLAEHKDNTFRTMPEPLSLQSVRLDEAVAAGVALLDVRPKDVIDNSAAMHEPRRQRPELVTADRDHGTFLQPLRSSSRDGASVPQRAHPSSKWSSTASGQSTFSEGPPVVEVPKTSRHQSASHSYSVKFASARRHQGPTPKHNLPFSDWTSNASTVFVRTGQQHDVRGIRGGFISS